MFPADIPCFFGDDEGLPRPVLACEEGFEGVEEDLDKVGASADIANKFSAVLSRCPPKNKLEVEGEMDNLNI